MRTYASALCGLAAIVSLSHFSFAQANVNESLETAFIYVDGTKGSDSNSGTKTSPLKTIGAAATMVTRSVPGVLLGLFVVAGTIAAALAVRPRSGRLILPVPVLSYLVAALISGVVYNRSADSSKTALAIGAAQWIANGFFAMALATVLAAAIIAVRWYLWRRNRPATRGPDWPAGAGRDGTGRRPGATWETSAGPGYPEGFAGRPGSYSVAGGTSAARSAFTSRTARSSAVWQMDETGTRASRTAAASSSGR